jgi:hypothetical protein
MTADNFTAWMARMNLNLLQAAAELGIGRNTAAKYAREGAPRYIGLACSAIAQGFKPWGGK